MGMSGDEDGDVGKFGCYGDDVVRKIVPAAARFQPHVTRQHDRVRAFAFGAGDRATNRLDRMFKTETAHKLRTKPKRHSRRGDSDDRDLDSFAFFQDVWPEFRE